MFELLVSVLLDFYYLFMLEFYFLTYGNLKL